MCAEKKDSKIEQEETDSRRVEKRQYMAESLRELKCIREQIYQGQLKQEENKNEILSAIASNR
jgi:hypothetical protein